MASVSCDDCVSSASCVVYTYARYSSAETPRHIWSRSILCDKHAKLMQLGLLSCEPADCSSCIAEPVPPFLWLLVCGRCGARVWEVGVVVCVRVCGGGL